MKLNVKENKQFRILSAFGIILVVVGHLGYNLFDIGGLFPYYSFHVFIFLFVSGYFYKEESEKNILSFIGKKFVTLMIPYFLWNLFYGILTQILHMMGFSIGENLSLKTLFISPFIDGHQFLYNFPAWFVPALFLIEIINVVMRKILGLFHLKNEWLIFAVCLFFGMITVHLAIEGHVWGLYNLPGRLLFMLPGFQMGRIYREKLEIHDILSDGFYFMIVIGVQLLISVFCAGLAFSAVWVGSFANGPIVPYLTVITGIAFWLRISKIISEVPFLSTKMIYIGRNTYSIMMNHIIVFMMVKGFFYFCSQITLIFGEFDQQMFFYDIGYIYLVRGTEVSKWIYLLAAISVPLLIAKYVEKIKDVCFRFFNKCKKI